MTRLEGKTVIVTEAGRGIGREYALRTAQDGANVVIGDVHRDNGEAVAKDPWSPTCAPRKCQTPPRCSSLVAVRCSGWRCS
ncbi:MAG: SDR family NAD(P)-dependent oxidoreductase [Mycobacterium sp.]